jgi:hypothetical protein
MHGALQEREVFRLQVIHDGQVLDFQESATPARLRLVAAGGFVELCMPTPERIAVHASGVALRLLSSRAALTFGYATGAGAWEINAVRQRTRLRIAAVNGTIALHSATHADSEPELAIDLAPAPAGGELEASLWNYDRVWKSERAPPPYLDSQRLVTEDFAGWLRQMPSVPQELGEGADLAAYVNWESVVAAKGHLTQPAMLMSKNLMINIWSWDNCFNAMSLWAENPSLAWSQLALLTENQGPEGIFPDHINDVETTWGFTKPPIYGWCYQWLVRHHQPLTHAELVLWYKAISRCTRWWMRYRDSDGDGLPEYNHGNDSGWDNSTVFEAGAPLETPDLAAFLSLQMEALGDMATELGRPSEAVDWRRQGRTLQSRMLKTLWRGDHFVALHAGDHTVAPLGSLLLYLPLVLGDRLPPSVTRVMVSDLKRHYLTEQGFSTEALDSARYVSDGYWRGPIWAPASLILVDGLDRANESTLAQQVRLRFCRMAAHSGMYENFDARTGKGLRDPAYTWTSSVFLIMAHDLLLGPVIKG